MKTLRRGALPLLLLLLLVAAPPNAQSQNTDGVVDIDISRLGRPLGEALQGEALDQATLRIADVMRCPVCQGMSIEASPSPMAVAMKEQVRELLSMGYTAEQVWGYFEGSYGEFVRLEPKREGLNWLVWLVPPAGILLGALLVVAFQRSQRGAEAEAPAQPSEPLDRFLEEVRRETKS